jgi:predicted transcriptional regulator YdeE
MTSIVENRDLPAMTLIGLARPFLGLMSPTPNGHDVIPGVWGELFDALDEADEFEFGWAVGMMSDEPGSGVGGQMNYFAGLVIDEAPEYHPGLTQTQVAAGKYAICEHIGSLDELGETTRWFYEEYLPSSGVVMRDANHLEVYDERFDPESDHSVVMICVPIEG